MLAVKGNEYSNSHHMNAFHNFTRAVTENGVIHVENSGGVSQLNHPRRYSTPKDWVLYLPWYSDYPSLIGMEVVNLDERELWDNINERLFPAENRFVWGLVNDDMHGSNDLYRAFQFMIMPALNKEANITSLENGEFYFCREPGRSGEARVPRIKRIDVSNEAKQITIEATGFQRIRWVGPGTKQMATGRTFDFSQYVDKPFVRAVLEGDSGDCFTQPFGMITK
jgi:hypothetical protein